MISEKDCSLMTYLSIIPDPRIDRTKKHELIDIMAIAVCAAISGAENWTDIETFGNSKKEWFDGFLNLHNGIPSHDTFRRLFMIIDPVEFNKAFYAWVSAVNSSLLKDDHVCIDGKALRKSYEKAKGISAIHMVNAWSTGAALSLGQLKSEGKKNEIKTIPKILDLLNIKGCLISIDAMGCQKDIAKKIIDKEGDYLLALKGNQEYLEKRVREEFDKLKVGGKKSYEVSKSKSTSEGHGRIEEREVKVITAKDETLAGINVLNEWENLKSIVEVKSTRIIATTGEVSESCNYYISSATKDASCFGSAVRAHWEVENCLHWRLDVIMNEDFCRSRSGNSAENFSTLRHLALNLLKSAPSKKSVRQRMKAAGWDDAFLLQVLLNNGKSRKLDA